MEKYFIDDPFNKIWPKPWVNYYFTQGSDGIIQINYPETNYRAAGISQQYHATIISVYALSQFNMFLDSGDKQFKETFLTYTDWLVDNLADMDGFAAWNFNFVWKAPGYKCKPPWISSMTQGMGISALLRASELTGDPKYLSAADSALSAFKVPISRGGLLRVDKHGDTWYEGIPSPIGAQILNEALFALIGLYEMYQSTGNTKAGELFNRGLSTVRKHLKDFDLNLLFFKWSRYDNKLIFYSGDKYHEVHLQQLRWLSDAVGDDLLAQYYEKWKSWQNRYTSKGGSHAKYLFGFLWFRFYTKYLKFYTKHLQG